MVWKKIRKTIVRLLRQSPFYPFPAPNYIQWRTFWDEMRQLPTWRFHRVLDAGIGPGHYTVTFAEKFPHCQVTGYDLSDCSLQGWCRESPSNLSFKVQDLKKIEEQNHYDLIYSIEVLEHIPENEKVMSRLARAIAPGGYLFIHMPYETDDRWIFPKRWFKRYREWAAKEHIGRMYRPEELATLVQNQGLEVLKCRWTAGRLGQLLCEFDELCRAFPRLMKWIRFLTIPLYKPLAIWISRRKQSCGSVMLLARKPEAVAKTEQLLPLVSVLMATFKSERFIERSLKSVLEQTYKNLEIIIIDEGHRDRTEEIVTSFKDPRITFRHDDENTGLSGARNKGIHLAKGKYVAFLDADDRWHHEKIAKQVALFQKHPDAGVTYCGIRFFTEDQILGTRRPVHQGNVLEAILGDNAIGNGSTLMIRKDCFEKAGLFDESLRMFAEDQELLIRIARHYNFYFTPECLIDYYLHDANKTGALQKKPTRTVENRLSIYERHKDLYERFPKAKGKFFRRIGLQYLREGRGKEARPYLREALKVNPADIKNWAGMALSFTGAPLANFAIDRSNRIHGVHHAVALQKQHTNSNIAT